MKTFLLIDDHVIIRSSTRDLLIGLYEPCEVYEAGNDKEATDRLKERNFDLIIMDIQVPDADMPGLMRYVQVNYPSTKVLVFSMSSEKIYAGHFLKAGAKGFVSKNASLQEIRKAISTVISGKRYMSEDMVESMFNNPVSNELPNPFKKLSVRELEISTLLLSGQPLKDIARILNLQPSTVATHKARIFEKLTVTNLLELKELSVNHHL